MFFRDKQEIMAAQFLAALLANPEVTKYKAVIRPSCGSEFDTLLVETAWNMARTLLQRSETAYGRDMTLERVPAVKTVGPPRKPRQPRNVLVPPGAAERLKVANLPPDEEIECPGASCAIPGYATVMN